MVKPSLSQRIAWRLETAGFHLLTSVFRLMPLDMASDFGAALLKTIGPLNGVHRTAAINLKIAFPHLTDRQLKAMLAAQWDEFGRTIAEFPLMERIVAQNRIEIVHIERMHAIRDSQKPVVLISGHFSNWEVMAAAIVLSGVRCLVTYRPTNNPHMDKHIRDNRAGYGVELFGPKGEDGARESLAALKRGISVALLNDQKFGGGVKGPFFGVEVETAPGPTRLAIRFGTVLQPLTVERIKGARFRVIAHEPIIPDQTGDRAADIAGTVAHINAWLEDRIRARPHEWFWTHRRWPKEIYKKDVV